MEYVVLIRPKSSPACPTWSISNLSLRYFLQTYRVIEPREPYFVDLDVIEDRSVKTVQNHTSRRYHSSVPLNSISEKNTQRCLKSTYQL
jgi:hypothetical protein